MKTLLFAVLSLVFVASLMLAPAAQVFAAPEWTCNSVSLNVTQSTRNVVATLNYAASQNELVELVWGDGVISTVHSVGSTSYPTSMPHFYGYGSFTLQLRVWNTTHDAFSSCNPQTVMFKATGCSGSGAYACTLVQKTGTRVVTATVTYTGMGGAVSLNWGDGSSASSLPSASQTNYVTTHTMLGTSTGPFTVTLTLKNAQGQTVGTCTLQVSIDNPTAVTISSLTAKSVEADADLAIMLLGGMGVVVLGSLMAFAIRRR